MVLLFVSDNLFTFQKESFRKSTKTNHDNWWYKRYHPEKLVNVSIFQLKKFYILIKDQWQNKLILLIPSWKSFSKTKQKKPIENQVAMQIKAIEEHGKKLAKSSTVF